MKVARPKLRGATRAGLFLGLAATVLAATAIVAQPAHGASKTVQIYSGDWGYRYRHCVYSEAGAFNTLGLARDYFSEWDRPCDDDRSVWVLKKVDTTAGGTTLYNIRHGDDDKCVGVQGVESGDTHIGQVLQLEGCENRDDGRWYVKKRSGETYIHNYSPNHRDLVMQAGKRDLSPADVHLAEYPGRKRSTWELKEL